MSRFHPSADDLEDGGDEPDLPRCVHCGGTVCVHDGCTAENDCPHGGKGVKLSDDRWACASEHCRRAAGTLV